MNIIIHPVGFVYGDFDSAGDYRHAVLKMSEDDMEKYINKVSKSGRKEGTVQIYRNNLYRFYCYLDEEKRVSKEIVEKWKQSLLEAGYAARTINAFIAPVNGFMDFMGHRELQTSRIRDNESAQPELTREEYLRMLSAARILRKERAYLLIKALATTGITVGEMEHLTAEAVEAGQISLDTGCLRIPGSLQEELRNYVIAEGITTGPIFLTKAGKPQNRTALTVLVKSVCCEARVPVEKANPRCLRKLYLTTRNEIQDNLARLVEEEYDRLLTQEQSVIGWK